MKYCNLFLIAFSIHSQYYTSLEKCNIFLFHPEKFNDRSRKSTISTTSFIKLKFFNAQSLNGTYRNEFISCVIFFISYNQMYMCMYVDISNLCTSIGYNFPILNFITNKLPLILFFQSKEAYKSCGIWRAQD